MQLKELDLKDYVNRNLIYILKSIAKEFIKNFI